MYSFVLVVHIIVVITLAGLILIQRGRSSGLVEALGGVESIFGTKTSSFFVKVTVVLAVLFFTTSISLAYLSKQKHASLLGRTLQMPESAGRIQPLPEEKIPRQQERGSEENIDSPQTLEVNEGKTR